MIQNSIHQPHFTHNLGGQKRPSMNRVDRPPHKKPASDSEMTVNSRTRSEQQTAGQRRQLEANTPISKWTFTKPPPEVEVQQRGIVRPRVGYGSDSLDLDSAAGICLYAVTAILHNFSVEGQKPLGVLPLK